MATGAVNLALLIIAALKNRERFAGRSDVVKMIEAGKDIMAVPIRVDQAEQFDKLAKENKLACGYIHDPVDRDVYNVIIKTEDAQRVNEICKEAGIEVGSNIDEKKSKRRSIRQRIEEIKQYHGGQIGLNDDYDGAADDENAADGESGADCSDYD